jgi:rubrerythrin
MPRAFAHPSGDAARELNDSCRWNDNGTQLLGITAASVTEGGGIEMSDELLSLHEILDMAHEVELNGEILYRRAADMVMNHRSRKMFVELADLEAEHAETFLKMRQELPGRSAIDPDAQTRQHMRAFAAGHIFDRNADPVELLKQVHGIEGILKLAIQVEKDTVIFYIGFQDLLRSADSEDRLEKIIHEEMAHIYKLSDFLRTL